MSLYSRSGAPLSVTRNDDVVAGYDPLISVISASAAVIDLSPATAYALGRRLIDVAGDEGHREALIASGHLAPGARGMSLSDAIVQYNEVNALNPTDADYIHPPAPAVTLDDAVKIIPAAWHDGIAADAATQSCTVSYTAAAGGLRTETIHRIQHHFVARKDDADWERMSAGQQLDEVFPDHNGIGVLDLLAELGIAPVYLLRDR
ncbi:hypothetical protein [Gordonia sp. MP11Mi]|uniref:Uncharacterized protein n=1 Tax=Gordonia sp. MP11Mi TaxID=3022769 RepID=A0AA97GWW4_9ACTN